ncbi:MAG: DUF2914 domain-containing protein [Deltaproteobacteria bacterium]
MRKLVALASVLALLGIAAAASAAVTVEDAVVCTAVTERTPEGTATTFPPEVGRIYAFTRVVGMESPGTVTHRWVYGGDTVAEVSLEVNSPSWRTWSSKEILPEQTGEWKVEILDGAGNVLATLPFTVGAAAPAAQ